VLVILSLSAWWAGGRLFAPMDILHEMLPPWNHGIEVPDVHNHFVSDAVTQYIPYHMLAARSLKEDGYIGWNPYGGTGSEFHANTMALPGDWSLQLYRWFDFWTAWHLGLMGQLILAGCGMLVFLRYRGCRPWAALVGAIVFAGNGQFVTWFFHRWALACFCWVPWVLWALFEATRRSQSADVETPSLSMRRTGFSGLAAAFLALAFLGGTLQHAAYVVLIVTCFWVGEILLPPSRRGVRVSGTALVAAIGFAGLLLAAGTLVPCAEAYAASRAAGNVRGAIGYPEGRLQALYNAVSYAFYVYPAILGSPQTLDAWKSLKSDLFNVAYLGTVPTVLAFLAIARREFPSVARLCIVTGLLIPLTPLVGPLYHRVLLLFVFGGAWACADFLSNRPGSFQHAFARRGLIVAASASLSWLLASLLLFPARHALTARVRAYVNARLARSQFGTFEQWFDNRAVAFVNSLFIWNKQHLTLVLPITAGLAVLYVATRRGRTSPRTHALLAVIIAVELAVMANRWITAVDPSRFPPYPAIAGMPELMQAAANGRVAHVDGATSIAHLPFAPNIPSVYGVAHLKTYESIWPLGLWSDKGYGMDPDTLVSLGVTHMLAVAPLPVGDDWTLVRQDGSMSLYRPVRESVPVYSVQLLESGGRSVWRGITPALKTPNTLSFMLEPGTTAIRVIAKPSPHWQAVGEDRWHSTRPCVRDASSQGMVFGVSPDMTRVHLVYRPPLLQRHPLLPPVLCLGLAALLCGVAARSGRRWTADGNASLEGRRSPGQEGVKTRDAEGTPQLHLSTCGW